MAMSSSSSSGGSSPCAACKFLRRKCTAGCVFAPYFPAEQPSRFAHVHKVFGASNVAKLLQELPPQRREDAVHSLAYEAEARIKDPVYGCVGAISILQRQVAILQQELAMAQTDLQARLAYPVHLLHPHSYGATTADQDQHYLHDSPLLLAPGHSQSLQQQHLQEIMSQNNETCSPSFHGRPHLQQLLDQLQRDTWLPRDQLVEQLTRVGGGSLEAGIKALAATSSGHVDATSSSGPATSSSRTSPVLSTMTTTTSSDDRHAHSAAAAATATNHSGIFTAHAVTGPGIATSGSPAAACSGARRNNHYSRYVGDHHHHRLYDD